MHIELSNKKLQNTKYIADVQQGFHDKNSVIIYLTNGTKFVEGIYENETAAKTRVEEIRELISY